MQAFAIPGLAFVTTVATGFALGVALGISGLGGGTVLTPLLILWFRLPATVAVGTSIAFSLATKVVGGLQHLRQGTIHRPTVIWLAMGSLPGAIATSLWLGSWGRQALSEGALQHLLGVVIVASAAVMTLRLLGLLQPLRRPLPKYALIPVGAVLGAVFALTSVGSGSLTLAVLIVLSSLTTARLVGTDVSHAALMAAATAPIYLLRGDVDLSLLLPLLLGSLPGVVIGSKLAARVPERLIKGTVLVTAWAIAARLV